MGKRSKSQTTLSISVPKWLVKAIKTEAERTHRSASGYIAAQMEAFLAREDPSKYGSHAHPHAVVNGNNNHTVINGDKKH
jgi:hypothetical protein